MIAIYQIGETLLGWGESKDDAIKEAAEAGYEFEPGEIKSYRKGQTAAADCVWLDLPNDFAFNTEDEDDLLEYALTGPGRPPGTPNPNAGRPAGQYKHHRVAARISDKAAGKLQSLCEEWGCNKSEAIERLIIKSR